jgi:hypothetical protein
MGWVGGVGPTHQHRVLGAVKETNQPAVAWSRHNHPPHPLPLLASTPQAAALVVYLFSGWFIGNFVLTFVILILLLAFDFWTVKVRQLVL